MIHDTVSDAKQRLVVRVGRGAVRRAVAVSPPTAEAVRPLGVHALVAPLGIDVPEAPQPHVRSGGAPVVGITTAPSLATASIDSQSSTWLPSMTMTRSPLPTPSACSHVATRSDRSAISAKVYRCSSPPSSVIHNAACPARSGLRAMTSNQSVAQLKAPVSRGQLNESTACA